MKEIKKIVGILLAGGLSRRYGSPKAFAKMNEKYFYETAYDALANVSDEVIVVTRDEFVDWFPVDYHVIVDKEPFVGCGPLAGIYAGMETVQADHYAVLPCDMPLINDKVMKRLISLHKGDITVVTSEGFLQPLVSIWSAHVKHPIKTALSQKKYKMTSVLKNVHTIEIDGNQLTDSPHIFMNVNTLENDKELRKWIKS